MTIQGIEKAYEEFIGPGLDKDTDKKRIIVDYRTLTMVCDFAKDGYFRPLDVSEIDVLNFAFNRHETLKLTDITIPVLNALAMEAINATVDSKFINDWISKKL